MNVICYGDSNTWGYDPRGYFGGRYDEPWPSLLPWKIQNLGENGREIPGFPVTFPENTDLLIVMLGTNDLLQGGCAVTAAKRMVSFLTGMMLEPEKILLIAPPPLKLGEWVSGTRLIEESRELTRQYDVLSRRLGIRFADAGRWNIPLAFDGVHFTEEGHRAFAENLINYLNKGE